jgi:hypothetical protein
LRGTVKRRNREKERESNLNGSRSKHSRTIARSIVIGNVGRVDVAVSNERARLTSENDIIRRFRFRRKIKSGDGSLGSGFRVGANYRQCTNQKVNYKKERNEFLPRASA